jgi:hypothetical protein
VRESKRQVEKSLLEYRCSDLGFKFFGSHSFRVLLGVIFISNAILLVLKNVIACLLELDSSSKQCVYCAVYVLVTSLAAHSTLGIVRSS